MNAWEAKDKMRKEERLRKKLGKQINKHRSTEARLSESLVAIRRDREALEDLLVDSVERSEEYAKIAKIRENSDG